MSPERVSPGRLPVHEPSACSRPAKARRDCEGLVADPSHGQQVVAQVCKRTVAWRSPAFWAPISGDTHGKIVCAKAANKRGQSVRKLSSRLTRKGHQVSKTTVHKYMKQALGLTPYRRAQQPKISEKKTDEKARVALYQAEELDRSGLRTGHLERRMRLRDRAHVKPSEQPCVGQREVVSATAKSLEIPREDHGVGCHERPGSVRAAPETVRRHGLLHRGYPGEVSAAYSCPELPAAAPSWRKRWSRGRPRLFSSKMGLQPIPPRRLKTQNWCEVNLASFWIWKKECGRELTGSKSDWKPVEHPEGRALTKEPLRSAQASIGELTALV